LSEALGDVLADLTFERLGEDVVNLHDEGAHLGDEFDEAFRHEDNTVVLSNLRAATNNISHMVGHLGEGHFFGLNLFTDQDTVDLGSERTLEGDVGRRPAHESYEMVVLLSEVFSEQASVGV
jgi:hypothetical protein